MPRYLEYVTLDVFTTDPFAGNPLAVVLIPDDSPEVSQKQKQEIAREFNYSETIFIHSANTSSPTKRIIDIFMTDRELPFAGHPVIGAASWLLCLSEKETQKAIVDTIITKAGDIPLSLSTTSADVVSAMIPYDVHTHKARFPLSELLRLHPTLSLAFSDSHGQNVKDFPVFSIVKGVSQVFIGLPNMVALESLSYATGGEEISADSATKGGYLDEGWGGDGLVVPYFYVRDVWDEATKKSVIRTRMLYGAFEDAATGSAASALGSYLSLVDAKSLGSYDYDIVQGVEMGRRSEIGVKVIMAEDRKRIASIVLSGNAVKIAEGKSLVKDHA
jgi:PhzF family phenazine biosynthesis protein